MINIILIHLGLSWIQHLLTNSCLMRIFFWALPPYLSTVGGNKFGNGDSQDTQWHSCKFKPENSTLSPCNAACTKKEKKKKRRVDCTRKMKQSIVMELKLCFLGLCEAPRFLCNDQYRIVSTTHSSHSQMIGLLCLQSI